MTFGAKDARWAKILPPDLPLTFKYGIIDHIQLSSKENLNV